MLIEHHWYLLEIDWIDGRFRIYDSLATSKTHQCLFEFGTALLSFITEEFVLNSYDWTVVPEQVSGFHSSLTGF